MLPPWPRPSALAPSVLSHVCSPPARRFHRTRLLLWLYETTAIARTVLQVCGDALERVVCPWTAQLRARMGHTPPAI